MITKKMHLYPLLLTLIIPVIDQLTKYLVIEHIPRNGIGFSILDGFFRIIHVRNLGMAFSLGHDLSSNLRIAGLIVMPLVVMVIVMVYFFKTDELNLLQRYALCGIMGGGIGNVAIDRIFRPEGVVDFLSFKIYGLFWMDYFPTFNVADMSVTVCGFLMLISIIIQSYQERKAAAL